MRKSRCALVVLTVVAGLAFVTGVAGAGTKQTKHPTYALGTAKRCRTGYVKIEAKKTKMDRVKIHGKWAEAKVTVRYAACEYIAVAADPPRYAPTTTTITATPTTGTATPPITTASTTTTTSTTTAPAPGNVATTTVLSPVNPNDPPPPNYCVHGTFCFPDNGQTVFSALVMAGSTAVSLEAGQLNFVFDAPVTDTSTVSPFEYDQFTLTTTVAGQTSCPLTWISSAVLIPSYWESNPTSLATDGVPACTVSNVYVYDLTTGSSVLCTLNPGGATNQVISDENCPNVPEGEEPGSGAIIGAALNWEVTANYTGEGSYDPSYSAPGNVAVGPAPTQGAVMTVDSVTVNPNGGPCEVALDATQTYTSLTLCTDGFIPATGGTTGWSAYVTSDMESSLIALAATGGGYELST